MQITLKLVGFLATMGLPSGFKGGQVTLQDGATIEDLLATVGVPTPTQHLIVRAGQLADLNNILRDGDEIELVPPIGGG
jgi:sulfur carrier protein ThiS